MNTITKTITLSNSQNSLLSVDNIMSQRLPQYMRIKNNTVSTENKLKLRKIWNVIFKGKSKKQQKQSILNTAQSLKTDGKKIKNVGFAYKYLAKTFNERVLMERNAIILRREKIRVLLIERRKTIKKVRKELIKLKLGIIKKLVIEPEDIKKISPRIFVNLVVSVLKNTFSKFGVLHSMFEGKDVNEEGTDIVNIYHAPKLRYYTLNESNKPTIVKVLQNLDDGGEGWEYVDGYAGEFYRFDGVEITIPAWTKDPKYKLKNGTIKTKKYGGFFRWVNINSEFDLSKYGVFTSVEPTNYNINCVIRALKEGGLCEEKIILLKSFVVNREISMSKFKIICDKLEICIRVQKLSSDKKATIYGKKYIDETYNLGLIDNHYFLVEKVDFTMFAFKRSHLSVFKLVDNFKEIYKIRDGKYKRDAKRFTDSFKVIKYMMENKDKYLKPISIDNEILSSNFADKAFDLDELDYHEDNVLLNETPEEIKEKMDFAAEKYPYDKWFFDLETFNLNLLDDAIVKRIAELKPNTKGYGKIKAKLSKRLYKREHVPFMAVAYNPVSKMEIVATGEDCVATMLKLIDANKSNKKVLMIAHNCGYDYPFLRKHLFGIDEKIKGSGLMNSTAKYYNHTTKTIMEIEFKCSYKIIPMGLGAFGKCFNMKISKEVMPYDLYSRENLKKNWVDIRLAKPHLKSTEEYILFKNNCKKLKLTQRLDGVLLFDMMGYSESYCKRDVKVLTKGYETFRKWINEALDIDVDRVWTIASLANKYLELEGVYKGVYKLSGRPRHFIQKCVVGGRTMCRDNLKSKIDTTVKGESNYGKKIADADATSLYPSAMVRMLGTLMGKPKIIENLTEEFLKTVDGYFIKIRVDALGKKLHFPLLSAINDKGVRIFTNDVVGQEFYVDKCALEDAVEFQEIKYTIIKGYYYNEGRNPQIRKTLQFLFDERVKKKKDKNPIQVVYKLIMNASYGKTILKPIVHKHTMVDNEEAMKKHLLLHNNSIIEYEKMYNCKKWKFKEHQAINEHFNNCVVGVEILSMSKRIMNEVMVLAEDNNLKAYYQDTDSIHMDYDEVAVLYKKFKEKYGRVLDGKKLGQFHIDFELKDAEGKSCTNIYAEKSIFLGKKCYIDCLVGTSPTGEIVRGFHVRMKGIPSSTVGYTADMNNINKYELYERLYDGEAFEFDLLENGKRCNFEFRKDGSITSMGHFSRTVGFK